MTCDDRARLRQLVDQARRATVLKFPEGPRHPRNEYWRAYYWENRDRILERRRQRRQAA